MKISPNISDKELELISIYTYEFNLYGRRSVEAKLKKLGYTQIDFIGERKKDTEAIICKKGKDVVLAYCGTNSAKEALFTDGRFASTKTPMGRIHKGVWKTFKKTEKKIRLILRDKYLAFDPISKLYITGHSLGGMLANTMSMWIAFNSYGTVYNIVTFGEPRTLKRKTAKTYNLMLANRNILRKARYRHERDMATRMFPKVLGYRHVGDLYYIDTKSKTIINPKRGYLIRDAIIDIKQFPTVMSAIKDAFKDHNKTTGYYNNL